MDRELLALLYYKLRVAKPFTTNQNHGNSLDFVSKFELVQFAAHLGTFKIETLYSFTYLTVLPVIFCTSYLSYLPGTVRRHHLENS